ncbi:MAG TPA: DUF6531 domain-containing protein, partial [Methylomirabilota bacterium]|nr:DUF6531 domain-containing protein [Methylomirabilota bacterium]
ARLWRVMLVVLGLIVVAGIAMLLDPQWLAMHLERRRTMATPGGARRMPDPALLATFPALPTGWHGSPIPLFPGQPAPSRWSVNICTGAFVHVQTDVYLPDVIPINLSRTYSSFDYEDRDFGLASSASYEFFLSGDNTVFNYIDIEFAGGAVVHMPRISPGTSYDATYQHRATTGDSSDIFDQARLWWHSPWYFSSLKDGTGLVFPSSRWAKTYGQRAAIMIQDARQNVLDIKRDESGNIVEINSPNGQKLLLTHDGKNRITSANDSHGYTVYYSYDDSGRLRNVIDSAGESTEYAYDVDDNMVNIRQPDGRTWLANNYDKQHRVIDQTYLDGGHAHYAYSLPDPSGVKVTDVTRPDGSIDHYTFNRESRLIHHTRQASTNLGASQ